ncbi:MAG TPA: ATPase, T2SS/T4P/T4SS family [Pseudomonadales bacterium]|nr:ATPase, T2SS/T4P/T4SS family [Pseudomonadales bacterium]
MKSSESLSQSADRKLDLRRLLEALQAQGRLSRSDFEQALGKPRDQAAVALHPLVWIARQQYGDAQQSGRTLDLETLTQWLAQQIPDQQYYHIDPLKIDVAAITEVMSFAFSQRHQILAVEVQPQEVVVASAQPLVQGWEPDLAHVLRKPIRRVVANPEEIERLSVELYTLARSVNSASARGAGPSHPGLGNLEQLLEIGQLKSPDANDQHIVNIVDWLLQYAFDQRASDIHIEPRRDVGNLRFRIDGVLHTVYQFPSAVTAAVTSRLKALGRLNVAEKRKPQDGRLKTRAPAGNEVELRISTLPTAFGEKMVLRIFDPEVLLRSFAQLGLTADDFTRWEGMIHQPNGIVLVTGPTGSGKTTTLYSSLKRLATPQVNLCTIEDPIEMIEPTFNQMQVQHNIDLSFASGVRALLRQDPDIIMIGEIRDLETAEMAIQAALTGHLVLSTLHTNDAPTAVTRLLELGVPPYLVKATLIGVMAQRLVRILCPHCKRAEPLDLDAWQALIHPFKVNPPARMCVPVGCLECRETGFLGREGIYEILTLSDLVREQITAQCDLTALRHMGLREGMHTLRLSGARKVAAGLTTVAEVLRVTPNEMRG